jgi:hypothetical protein
LLKTIDDKGHVKIDDKLKHKDILQKIIELQTTANIYYEEKKQPYFKSQAIIGRIKIEQIESSKSIFAMKNQKHFKIIEHELFENPILYVMGKLRIFKFDLQEVQNG